MKDTIYRQDAIDAMETHWNTIKKYHPTLDSTTAMYVDHKIIIEDLPPAQPEPCDLCSNLENGDTLYQYSDWDGGIGFDYIRDIQFCPKCGRRLKNDK